MVGSGGHGVGAFHGKRYETGVFSRTDYGEHGIAVGGDEIDGAVFGQLQCDTWPRCGDGGGLHNSDHSAVQIRSCDRDGDSLADHTSSCQQEKRRVAALLCPQYLGWTTIRQPTQACA